MKEVANNVFIETEYPGVNVGAIVTSEGIVCVDSPSIPSDAHAWRTNLLKQHGIPIKYVILTDFNADRALTTYVYRANIMVQESSRTRLWGYESRYPAPLLDHTAARFNLSRLDLNDARVIHPQISFCTKAMLKVGNVEIKLMHKPSATPGSLWVHLEKESILFTGDTLVVGEHPTLAEAETDNWLNALDDLNMNFTTIETLVPGRGPLCDLSAIQEISSFIRIVKQRVYSLFEAGRPRADTTSLIPDFIDSFPHKDVSTEWLQRQLKTGLDHVYDEIKSADAIKR
ncbi:MAG: hypothetical protein JXA42_14960 [Anaerolineales bacterium]|nr:hypothetical protein [Anaerolineales bacterium]